MNTVKQTQVSNLKLKNAQQKRIQQWKNSVDAFFQKLRQSIENPSATNGPRKRTVCNVVIEPLRTRVTEVDGASYTIAGLSLEKNGRIVSLEPKSSKTIGFGGRIDVLLPNGNRAFSVIRKGNSWKKMVPVKEIPALLKMDEPGDFSMEKIGEDVLKCLK